MYVRSTKCDLVLSIYFSSLHTSQTLLCFPAVPWFHWVTSSNTNSFLKWKWVPLEYSSWILQESTHHLKKLICGLEKPPGRLECVVSTYLSRRLSVLLFNTVDNICVKWYLIEGRLIYILYYTKVFSSLNGILLFYNHQDSHFPAVKGSALCYVLDLTVK